MYIQCAFNITLCIEYCIFLLKYCKDLFMTSIFYKHFWVYCSRKCSKFCPHSRFDWCLWLMDLFCEQGPIRILVSLMNKPHHRQNLCSMPSLTRGTLKILSSWGSKRQNLHSKFYDSCSQHQKWCKILHLPVTLSGLLININIYL